MTLPPPPVPADCDLRDFKFMPLDVVLLRDSSFSKRTTGDEFRAGVMLWCAAWHQVPAGSLPDDDAELSALAGYGFALKAWRKVKAGAMQKFEKCSDARWYHPEICKKAKNSWNEKVKHRWLRECERIKKRNARKSVGQTDIVAPSFDEWLAQNGQNVPRDNPPLSSGQPPDVPSETPFKGKGDLRDRESKGVLPPAAAAPAEHKKSKGTRLPDRWAPNSKIDSEFESWWKIYPGRVGRDGTPAKQGKKKCRELWPAARKAESFDGIMRATATYAKRTDPKYVVDPERWLKYERWTDEVFPAVATAKDPSATGMTVY